MKILLFNVNIFKQQSIREMCGEMHFDVCCVPETDYGKTVGNIAGLPAAGKNAKAVPFTEEMMVFCGMEPGQLDHFLEEYRRRQIAPIELKAVLTRYNAGWTPGRLCAELSKERKMLN